MKTAAPAFNASRRRATAGFIALLASSGAWAQPPAPPGPSLAPPPTPPIPPIPEAPAATAAQRAAQARWKNELAAFDQADRVHPPASGGVLFVGSSTFRLWPHLAQDFPEQPALLNRGFGGSTLADCSLLTQELVVRYQPRHVVLYAGDNDLAAGQTPTQVLESFLRFEQALRAALPHLRLSYVSIKPSPSREALMDHVRRTNRLIAATLYTLPHAEFIDVFTPMLDAEGHPRAELFRADRLHLNDEGYRLWQAVIAPHLAAPADAAGPARASAAPLPLTPRASPALDAR